jgi:hypothetical protein
MNFQDIISKFATKQDKELVIKLIDIYSAIVGFDSVKILKMRYEELLKTRI